MKKKLSKILVLTLSFLMVFTMSATAFADGTKEQITSTDNNCQIVENGQIESKDDGRISYSKMIYPTEKENEFDVQLQVTTTEEVRAVYPNMAVVLVIDASGSMKYGMNTDKDATKGNRRLDAAVTAANSFIEQVRGAVGHDSGVQRKIGVVSFNSTAKQVTRLKDVKEYKKNSLTTDQFSTVNATNIESGLEAAKKMLKDSKVDKSNQYILLLSDGRPNCDAHASTNGNTTYHTNHVAVENSAKEFGKENLYSIYIGKENDPLECQDGNKNGNSCDWTGKDSSIFNWLESFSAHTYATQDDKYLEDCFEEMGKEFASHTNVWSIEDPMGAHIEYLKEVSPKDDEGNVIDFDFNNKSEFNDGKLTWVLRNSKYMGGDVAGEKTFMFRYRIKFDNTFEGFIAGNPNEQNEADETKYETNGKTLLHYSIDEVTSPDETKVELKTVELKVPKVEGYVSNVEFKKVDANPKAEKPELSGATFTLTNQDSQKVYTATSDGNGLVKFENIPSGHKYKLVETNAPNGYITSNEEKNFEVAYGEVKQLNLVDHQWKNSEATSVTINKVWKDVDKNEIEAPVDSIDVVLTGNGIEKTAKLDSTNGWSKTWNDLPKYDVDGNIIEWEAKEVSVPQGYESIVGDIADGVITITNTQKPVCPEPTTFNIHVEKVWKNAEGEPITDEQILEKLSATVNLKADGEVVKTETLNNTNGWSCDFTELSPKNEAGESILYLVEEAFVQGYGVSYSAPVFDENGNCNIVITNTEDGKVEPPEVIEKTAIKVEKNWNDELDKDGIRPDKVTINLLANGEVQDTVELSIGKWTYIFNDLLAKDENDNPITYTVEEVNVPDGYTATVTGDATNGFVVTNTHTPKVDPPQPPTTTYVTVSKVWNDNNNEDGVRPASVTVNVLDANNKVVATVELNDSNNWTKTVFGLPIDGTYRVEEVAVNGYTAAYSQNGNVYTVTNTKKALPPEENIPEEPNTPDTPDVDIPEKPGLPDDEAVKGETPADEGMKGEDPDQPKTGDESNMAGWLAVLATSLAALGVTVVARRKENE